MQHCSPLDGSAPWNAATHWCDHAGFGAAPSSSKCGSDNERAEKSASA